MSSRPSWVTTEPGQPEAFEPLSKEEAEKLALKAIEEAEKLREGQGMQFAIQDQKLLLSAETRRTHHKKSAEVFGEIGNQEEGIFHRKAWAEAAIDLGKLDEAKEAVKSKGKVIDPDLRKFIDQIQKAFERPDSAECRCKREEVVNEKGETIQLPRRYTVKKIFSPYHNQFAFLVRCRHCPFMNVTLEEPQQQNGFRANQKQNDTQARIARAEGKPQPKGLPDAQVLKVVE